MPVAKVVGAACLTLALAILGSACIRPGQNADGKPLRGGTLRVLSAKAAMDLDTAEVPELARPYARTLYGYNLAGLPSGKPCRSPTSPPARPSSRPTGAPTPSGCGPGSATPPVNREVTAQDFITAIQRLYDKENPSYGQPYADLIAGTGRLGAGKASRISGLTAPDPRTLAITLGQPAPDFLSMLTLPLFAPVPAEYVARYKVGDNYSGHVAGTGPTPQPPTIPDA